MRLTRHFLLEEFSCQCVGKKGKEYCQGKNWIKPELVEGLQVLRNIINDERRINNLKTSVGIIISSGCRCRAHNNDVSEAKESQHIYGTAADIFVPGYTPEQLKNICLRHKLFTGIGIYKGKNILHVDVRNGLYGKVVVW